MSQTAFSLFLSVILRIFPLSLRWNSSSAPRSGRAASPAQHKHDSTSRCDLFPVKSAFGRGDRTDTGSPGHCDPNLREKANAQRFLNAPEIPRASNYPQLSRKTSTHTHAGTQASASRPDSREPRLAETLLSGFSLPSTAAIRFQEHQSSTTHPLPALQRMWRGEEGSFLSPTSLRVFCGEMLCSKRQLLCVDIWWPEGIRALEEEKTLSCGVHCPEDTRNKRAF